MDPLLKKVTEGDGDALATWMDQNRKALLRTLERKVGAGLRRKMELEDILQEVTARAVRDVSQVDFGEQDPQGWIYQVMDRQIVDLHRYHFEAKKRDAKREVSADAPVASSEGKQQGLANLLIASMTSPSAAVSRDMRLLRVYNALEALPEEQRNAIRWRYLENLPSQKIAEKLGKTDAATRVLLSRAIRKLQTQLDVE